MRKVAITLLGLLLMCAAAVASGAEIKLSDLEGTPNVYCRVVKEPNPALLGHFGCVHRSVNERSGEVLLFLEKRQNHPDAGRRVGLKPFSSRRFDALC